MAKSGWVEVADTQGIYEVDCAGRVRSWHPHLGSGAPRVLKPWPKGPKGHLAVNLMVPGRHRRVALVHRLVLAAFVGPCPDGMEVRHIDGDSSNNVLENIAYGTHSENELDKIRHGTHIHARKAHCKRGHAFVGDNIIWTGPERRYRSCRMCRKLRRSPRKWAA